MGLAHRVAFVRKISKFPPKIALPVKRTFKRNFNLDFSIK
jgi:hypothetical protein